MQLTIIIVSYNTADLLRNCLNSLFAQPPPCDFTVTVVDNASADDSVAMVRREFPQVRVIANERNLGYAAAINQGLPEADADYVLILNSDIEVHDGAVETLVQYMESLPQVGMCGPQLVLPDGRVQETWRAGFTLGQFARQQLLVDKLVGPRLSGLVPRPTTAAEVEHLDGAALLVRGAALRQVGPMDEGYWMYCEDSDWSLRFRRGGWKLCTVPAATMLHHHGASSRECRAEMIAAYNRAAARYFRLHEGPLEGGLARLLGLTGTSLRLFGAILGSVLTLGMYRPLTKKAALFLRALDLQVRRRI